jgi:hypothetical protein
MQTRVGLVTVGCSAKFLKKIFYWIVHSAWHPLQEFAALRERSVRQETMEDKLRAQVHSRGPAQASDPLASLARRG